MNPTQNLRLNPYQIGLSQGRNLSLTLDFSCISHHFLIPSWRKNGCTKTAQAPWLALEKAYTVVDLVTDLMTDIGDQICDRVSEADYVLLPLGLAMVCAPKVWHMICMNISLVAKNFLLAVKTALYGTHLHFLQAYELKTIAPGETYDTYYHAENTANHL